MNKSINIRRITKLVAMPLVFLISVTSLITFLLLVSPSSSSFIVSFVPLLLIWIGVYSGILSLKFTVKSVSEATVRTLAATVASVVMLLLMFSALGQVSVFDISLLLALAVLGVFYFRRSWPN